MREIDLLKYIEDRLRKKFEDKILYIEEMPVRLSLPKDLIQEAIHKIVYKEYTTIYYTEGDKIISKKPDETYEFLEKYYVHYGIITDMIAELDNDKLIDKIVFIGSSKSVFRDGEKELVEFPKETTELLLNSIKSFTSLYGVDYFYKRQFIKQSDNYTIEIILEYEPTVIVRRITKNMIEDNSLESKILSTLLNAHVVGSGDNSSIVSDVISLSEELNLKKKIKSLLREELTNIYANRNVL